MNDYVQRMIDEHKQLIERMKKLSETLESGIFRSKASDTQQRLLIRQKAGMEIYESALSTRLLIAKVDPYDDYSEID